MPLQDAQNGRPARPQRAKRRGVPLRYVESLSDARTKLADFFSILLRLSLNQGSPLITEDEHEDSYQDHGEGEELSHGEGPKDKPKVGIRFAKELYDHPADSIAGDKTPKESAWRRGGFRDDPYQGK